MGTTSLQIVNTFRRTKVVKIVQFHILYALSSTKSTWLTTHARQYLQILGDDNYTKSTPSNTPPPLNPHPAGGPYTSRVMDLWGFLPCGYKYVSHPTINTEWIPTPPSNTYVAHFMHRLQAFPHSLTISFLSQIKSWTSRGLAWRA